MDFSETRKYDEERKLDGRLEKMRGDAVFGKVFSSKQGRGGEGSGWRGRRGEGGWR